MRHEVFTMKKRFSILLAMLMAFFCFSSTTAFAAEPISLIETITIGESENTSVTPRGTLSGYGSVWYDSGTSTTGTFTVNVTGVSWINAHVTFSVDNFSSDEGVAVELYRPDGTLAWSSLENVGDLITMDNREQTKWQGISFLSGQTGTYTVKYSIFNFAGNVPGSGRINCWIY